MDRHRVKFYSIEDLATGYFVGILDEILKDYDDAKEYNDINTILEFFNINKYLENKCYPESWDDEKIEEVKIFSKKINKKVNVFINGINEKTIIDFYDRIDMDYIDDFWFLFEKNKLFKNISESLFEIILYRKNIGIFYILLNRNIVDKYDKIITKYMMENYIFCYEYLIDIYLKKESLKNKKCHIPQSLDKELLANKYINDDKANPNYLNLISNSTSRELCISNDLRFKAKKNFEKKINDIIKNGVVKYNDIYLNISEDSLEPVKLEKKNGKFVYTYNKSILTSCLDFKDILNLFINIFYFVDINIISYHFYRISNDGYTENLVHKADKYYGENECFRHVNEVAQLQIKMYEQRISYINKIRLEDFGKYFFEQYIKEEFKVNNFKFIATTKNSTYLEKSRMLCIEIESFLNQFISYCNHKKVNDEIIQMKSEQLLYENIPSLIQKKYIYINDVNFYCASELFFSKHSKLGYTPNISKYRIDFPKLITDYKLKINDFEKYKRKDIEYLIENEYIQVNDNGYLSVDKDLMFIMYNLYHNEVISYYHVKKSIQDKIDQLIDRELLRSESSLFSIPEYKYINYIMNRRDSINGLDLRNRYIHGSQGFDSKKHEEDYYIFLRIMMLCIIKINDEFILREEIEDFKDD